MEVHGSFGLGSFPNHSILFAHNSLPVHQWSINRCSFALLSCVNTPRLQDNCMKKNEICHLFARDLKSMCFFVPFWCSRNGLTLPAQRRRHGSCSTASRKLQEMEPSHLDASLLSAIEHGVCSVSCVSSVRLPYVLLEVAVLDVFKPERLDLRARSLVATCEQSPGASWDIWPNLRFEKRWEFRHFFGQAGSGSGRVDGSGVRSDALFF